MNILNAVRKFLPLMGIASFISMVGCERQSTPPGPSSSFGILEPNTHFQFFLWDEGLAILLIDNITKKHESSGSGSTKDPVYRQNGSAESKDGYRYEWKLETADGRIAEVEIDGNDFDIAKGVVFSITVTEEETTVDQIDLDLSQLSDSEDCRAFIKANREVLKLGDNIAD
jgi:hypothetical protein